MGKPASSLTSSPPTGSLAGLRIGPHQLAGQVLLAPMSGITDYPFRQLARALAASLVVSEMVASEHLVRDRHGARARLEGQPLAPQVVQLAGCEARWMAEGARLAAALGAEIIDINMGCPARQVTGKAAGSALMRDLDHAERLIAAVVGAVTLPVTLKMRLGWDEAALSAPELARRAEAVGVALITVHARTRCQFFKGRADWRRLAAVKAAVKIPVVVNGDIVDPASAKAALSASGADAVMVGRGACGQPWMPGRIARSLATGEDPGPPPLATQSEIALGHIEAMLSAYPSRSGLRNARKHIGWYLQTSGQRPDRITEWRRALLTSEDAAGVLRGIGAFYREAEEMAA
ncbi:MAG TPA: tRNA dihydrouridine synthase DusB [Hyphomicrobiaceae bacterium]|nr:tRNA dihydrouridine synthase DusB [Hyphomicrobiaceae bacterium]